MNIENFEKLNKEFYAGATEVIAKKLLGKLFVKTEGDFFLAGMIVEVEAYLSKDDFASHSAVGLTQRNKVMFEEAGNLYVYKIYGVHHCINIVTEKKGRGAAVLIRAIEPVLGIEIMQENRKCTDILKLCRGPGNIAKAFNFTLEHNGISLTSNEIFIMDYKKISDEIISIGNRIGIAKSEELNLRFFINDNKFISGTKKQNLY